MIRRIIKFLLFSVVAIVGLGLFSAARAGGLGVLPEAIIAIGTGAALRAIWKYNPSSKEITLNKED